jgi:hypothetical protein
LAGFYGENTVSFIDKIVERFAVAVANELDRRQLVAVQAPIVCVAVDVIKSGSTTIGSN